MRKVVAYELLSLDGVAEQPEEFITDFDDEMEKNLLRVITSQDTVLLGRGTFDDWAEFWPTSDIQPFADFINGVEKFVATSTTPSRTWHNSTIIDGDVSQFVTELKQMPGGDIGVHGSITLLQSLFEVGLVDELRLVVAPALAMHGLKLFDKGLPSRLALTRQVASPAGYLLLDFQFEG
jgi:dihydrofolate reductase